MAKTICITLVPMHSTKIGFDGFLIAMLVLMGFVWYLDNRLFAALGYCIALIVGVLQVLFAFLLVLAGLVYIIILIPFGLMNAVLKWANKNVNK